MVNYSKDRDDTRRTAVIYRDYVILRKFWTENQQSVSLELSSFIKETLENLASQLPESLTKPHVYDH